MVSLLCLMYPSLAAAWLSLPLCFLVTTARYIRDVRDVQEAPGLGKRHINQQPKIRVPGTGLNAFRGKLANGLTRPCICSSSMGLIGGATGGIVRARELGRKYEDGCTKGNSWPARASGGNVSNGGDLEDMAAPEAEAELEPRPGPGPGPGPGPTPGLGALGGSLGFALAAETDLAVAATIEGFAVFVVFV